MSLEGLWTAEFEVPGARSSNSAVVVLKGGRIYGGDGGYYYIGSYTVSDNAVSGNLQATHYHGEVGTAFGDTTASFSVQLAGKSNEASDQIIGTITRSQLGQIILRMKKRASIA